MGGGGGISHWATKFFAPIKGGVSRSKLVIRPDFQRKTKGQHLKGKIVSEIFTLFHNFSHFFIIIPLQNNGF